MRVTPCPPPTHGLGVRHTPRNGPVLGGNAPRFVGGLVGSGFLQVGHEPQPPVVAVEG